MTERSIRLAPRPTRVAVAAFLALAAGGADRALAEGPGRGTNPTLVEIGIDNFTFAPAEIRIAPGTTVRWVNHDDIPHTVVETNKMFKSKTLDTEDSFSTTFTTPGAFEYFCSLHPHMTGKVIVTSGS